ncbi:MAG: peptide ABC transporter substrate-binding protein [Alphaproteobacteria bacterium]
MALWRRTMAWILGAAVMALAAGPVLAAERDQLTIGITQFPSSFHPSTDPMVAKSYILAMTNRPITAYDKDWALVCMLCTELPTIENGQAVLEDLPGGGKGIAVTYTLQPRAVWGDGTPVTTSDVVFTWEVGRHPQSGFSSGELYRRIRSIDARDDKTFTLHLDRVTFDYNAINDFRLLPVRREQAAFADPAQYRTRTAFDTDTTSPGLFNGPYRIVEVERGSHVVLERNAYWFGAQPQFRRIVVKVVENTAALEANLLSGSVDYVAGELGLTLDQALAFEKRHGDRFSVIYKPGLTFEHIDLNLDNPALKDVRVRRALLLGLNRPLIAERLFGGRQPVADTAVNPLDWVHAKDITTYPHAPDRAAALLNEAGWRMGAGGLRRNAAGQPLTLELMTTAGNRIRELVEQVLQSQWKTLGVDVRIRNEPARVFFGETLRNRRFAALAMYAWLSAPESVPRSSLHSKMIPTAANNWAGQNYGGYTNPEMDDLIDRIEVELDRDKRKDLWRRLQQIYADDLPALPLYFRADPFILPRWLKGVTPTGHEDPSTLWVETWRAER